MNKTAMTESTLISFNSFAKNVHSQYGEDGIVEEILSRLEPIAAPERYCVEFGAWDGKYLSNTYHLIANKGFHAVLIEADPSKFKILCENIPQDTVTKINKFVTFQGSNTLDSLLASTRLPADFDFLSIDIDGNDYHVLESLKQYRPKLICIEYNPTISNEVSYVQPRDFAIKRGASPLSLCSLASRFGYAVVASTSCNLFFLRREFLTAVGLQSEPTLEDVRDDKGAKIFVFCGYDGSILLSKPLTMDWHQLTIAPKDLQVLPSMLRRYPDDYNVLQRIRFKVFRITRNWREAFAAWRK